ncbi:MAG: RNA methyltransferase [Planctomycetaceae bacterium]|nr:RNA methyltransferase [Planctomycetaceae bacterium]
MSLTLKNPHSVLAAFEARPGAVVSVTVTSLKPTAAWGEAADAARSHGVPVKISTERPHGGRKPVGEKQGRTGGSEAVVRERPSVSPQELFNDVDQNRPDVWLALDQVQDPHNLGAVFRTAAFFGVKGILLTRDRSAPMSSVVYDTATGGVEHVGHALVANLRSGLETAKKAGLWVLGSSEHDGQDVFEIPRDRPWLLVLGNEMSGMRRLTGETCDMTCRLTPRGGVTSLNVSVAAGALVAALCRE